MNIAGFKHTLEGDLCTYDPNILKNLKNKDFLINEFERQNLIIYKSNNFLVVGKAAPYSSEDFMVIYSGEDSEKTSISHLSNKENSELFELLDFINKKLLIDYKEIDDGNKELIIGINTSFIPGNGNIQSVSRPHFHFTLLSTKDQIINNVKTEAINITKQEEYIKKFCIREENDFLIDKLIYELDNYNFNGLKYSKSDIGCIDFELIDNENLFSRENIELINKIYDFVHILSERKFSSYDNINVRKNSFTMGFKKENGIYKMRIRYFHKKNPGDAGGIMESFNHLIIRNRVENPLLPDMEDFNKRIMSYF